MARHPKLHGLTIHASLLLVFACVSNVCGHELAAQDNSAMQADQGNAEPNANQNKEKVKAPTRKRAVTRKRKGTLEEVLKFAKDAYARIEQDVRDYTCELYKREYVDGEVSGWEKMAIKIRHEQKEGDELKVPFSVYLRFSSPVAGRAVLYVQNQNNGDLIARRGGSRSPNMTLRLDPEGSMAMDGNRYPVTEIGFKTLARRLIEVLEQELEHQDGEIYIWENALIDNRECTHFRLVHQEKRPGLTYHMAEVTVDNEKGVPIRYRAFDFAKEEGGDPQLLEWYAYNNVKINVGLTDKDFDHRNAEYKFQLTDTDDLNQ